jgi:hypothetical protein
MTKADDEAITPRSRRAAAVGLALCLCSAAARAQRDAGAIEAVYRVAVGVETAISARGVRSFSQTGPALDARLSRDGRTLLVRVAMRGTFTLLLIEAGGGERRLVFIAR